MKAKDLLDIMGEIDAGLIEDAAGTAENSTPVISRLSRYGAVAAAIGIVSISVYAIYSVVRDGIVQTQAPQSGYTSSADSGETGITSGTQSGTATTQRTLPTDLYVIETLESTTTTTTEKTLPFPADEEMPDASLEQEIGDRFLVNDLSQSGVIAMTVQKAEAFDSLEAAGLTENDLMQSYREGYSISQVHASSGHGKNKEECTYAEYCKDERAFGLSMIKYADVLANPENFRFIRLTLKIENINAISGLPSFWNQCRFSVNPEKTSLADGFNPFTDDYTVDPNFARDSDFDITKMYFTLHMDFERSYSNCIRSPIAYSSLSGQAYDDIYRMEWFSLEPGTAITAEIGTFVPKTYTEELDDAFVPDNWDANIPFGEDLLQRWYFGVGGISRPHVDLHFDNPENG
ncbi:MAG: hypothetical protein IJM46_09590 [Oscillospiraceae bacterium]|nr:hypothetical protein [Oscillospiraceae bacterium]